MRFLFAFIFMIFAKTTFAGPLEGREGWFVHPTGMGFAELVKSTRKAVKANGFVVVTQAGPTRAAAARGIIIPGNMVIGVFNNDFAVRVLKLSTAAMIEAPIRMYVTENQDKSATLSYKTPSMIFAPYLKEGGKELSTIADDLDGRFNKIAEQAVAK